MSGFSFFLFSLSYGRAVAKIVNEHFSAMRGVPPGFSCCPLGDGEEGGYNSIPIILVGRVLHLFIFCR